MFRHGSIVSTAFVLALFMAAQGSLRAQTIPDDAEHYSIELPESWEPMSAEFLGRINKFAEDHLPGKNIRYDRGFKLKGMQEGLFPYILMNVKHENLNSVSYEQLERSLSRDFGAEVKSVENALSDIGKNLSVGAPVLDRSKNQVIVRVQMEAVGAGKVKGLSIGHLASNNVITVIYYAKDSDFESRLPVFEQIDNSLKIDTAFAFKPASYLAGIFNGSWNGAIVGGAVAAVFVLFKSFSKKPGPTINRPS